MTPPLHAFVDESSRRNSYAICAATISIDDLDSTRKQLRALLLAGQRRIHFTTESDSRRRKILTAMADMNTKTHIYLATDSKNQDASRKALLEVMVPDLQSLDAVAWAWGRGGRWKATIERSGLVANVLTIA